MSNYTNGGGGPVSPLQFEYTSIVLGKTSGKVYFFSTGITNGISNNNGYYTYIADGYFQIRNKYKFYTFESAPKSFSVFPNESFAVCIASNTQIIIVILAIPNFTVNKAYQNNALQSVFNKSSMKTTVSKASYIYLSACNVGLTSCFICQAQQTSNKINCLPVNGTKPIRSFETVDSYLFIVSSQSGNLVYPALIEIYDFNNQNFKANQNLSFSSSNILPEASEALYTDGIIYTALITSGSSVLFANFNSTSLQLTSQMWERTGIGSCDFIYGINYNIENKNIYYLLSCSSSSKITELYEYNVTQSKFTNLYKVVYGTVITQGSSSSIAYLNRCEFIANSMILCAGGTDNTASLISKALVLITPYKQPDLLPLLQVPSSGEILFMINSTTPSSAPARTDTISQLSVSK